VRDKNLIRYILILWKYFSGGNLGDWFDRLRTSGNLSSDRLRVGGESTGEEKIALRGTDPESNINQYT
jgi:hypothetical protein